MSRQIWKNFCRVCDKHKVNIDNRQRLLYISIRKSRKKGKECKQAIHKRIKRKNQ